VLAGAIAVVTNLLPIQADTVYKQADPYDRQAQWDVAIEHYRHAIELAPKEDFYYLYLGRAYLEYASAIEDPAVRDNVMRLTEQTLIQAREINPLNTDHSANLARMYRRWADFASDDELRLSLLRRASENYDIATSLSPHNAILWNEWAMLYYYGLGDVAGYERALQRSLELDHEFEQTWLVCGDASRQQGKLEEAAHCYEEALELNPRASQVWRVLGETYITMQKWDEAIAALAQVLELQPDADDIWNIHQVLARLYSQIGQVEQALVHASTALQLAPEDQQAALQDLMGQLQLLGTPQP
jgi:tetratricopeptide (TPR) repeat protein